MSKKPSQMKPSIQFSWTEPLESIRDAQALPRDFTLKELCQFLGLSASTILRLRRLKGFPNPRGPNQRRVYYSKTEVLLWLLKDCGFIPNFTNKYIDKKNNIYLCISDEKEDVSSNHFASSPVSSSQDASVCVSSRQNDALSRNDLFKILIKYGINLDVFEEHEDELIEYLNQKFIGVDAIEETCRSVSRIETESADHEARLLLDELYRLGNKKRRGRPKGVKKEPVPEAYSKVDYDGMINELECGG